MRGEVLRNESGKPRKACALGRDSIEEPGEAGGECRGLRRQ